MILISDLHLTDKEADSYRWGIFSRVLILSGKLDREAEAGTNKTLVILGDLTDSKDHHSSHLVNKIVEQLHILVANGMEIFILMGNHDYINPAEPFFKFLGEIDGINYVGWTKNFILGGIQCLFLPHTRDPKGEWKANRIMKWGGNSDFVFMHQSVLGSVTSNGYEMEEGLKPSYFKRFKGKVISGDIHVPQDVGPVTYVGSPYSVRFNDHFEGSMLSIDKKKKITRYATGIPGRRMLDITSVDEIEAPEGFQVKVRVHLSSVEDWPSFKEEVERRCKDKNLKLQSVQLIKEGLLPLRRKRKQDPLLTAFDVIENFGNRRGLSKRQIKIGKEIAE